MDQIAASSNILSSSDWRKISLTLIRNNGGEVCFKSTVTIVGARSKISVVIAIYSKSTLFN